MKFIELRFQTNKISTSTYSSRRSHKTDKFQSNKDKVQNYLMMMFLNTFSHSFPLQILNQSIDTFLSRKLLQMPINDLTVQNEIPKRSQERVASVIVTKSE